MANPLIKITNNKIDYYVVWNTYYELPETIPMDLATFIVFLYEKKWSFQGIIACWNNLKVSNISLNEFELNTFLNENQFDFLSTQAADKYTKGKEIENREYCSQTSTKLDKLYSIYQQEILIRPNDELILKDLSDEFYLFISETLLNTISLLPLHLYNNINSTCDKLYSYIGGDKLNDFHDFLFSIPTNEEEDLRAANWFSKLLFKTNLFWHEIPYFVRKKIVIHSGDLIANKDLEFSFTRGYVNLKVLQLELTPKNLLCYFNHQIHEQYKYAAEIKNYFQEIELLGFEEEYITLNKLEKYLSSNLIDPEILPLKLFNLADRNDNLILPSIYTDCYEDNGLLKFLKYNEQLIDVYSKNGDLIFTNLYDINIIIKDNQLLAKYEGANGYLQHKKILINLGTPVQIYNIEPFDEWEN